MKIQSYNRSITPTGESTSVYSLAGERRSAMQIPKTGARARMAEAESAHAQAGMELQVGVAASRTADIVGKIGAQIAEAGRVEEESQAILAAGRGYADLMNQVETDEYFINATPEEHEAEYTKRSAALAQKVMDGISHPKAKQQMARKLQDLELKNLVRVRGMARERQVSRIRAKTDEELDGMMDLFVSSGDMDAIADAEEIIDNKVKVGAFSAEEGQQIKERFNKRTVGAYWSKMIEQQPEAAYMAMKEGADSLEALDADDRNKLMSIAKKAAEKAADKREESDVYAEMVQKYGTNNTKAIEWLENPDHYKGMKLQTRRYLINTFAARQARQKSAISRGKSQQAMNERTAIYEALINGDRELAVAIASKSKVLKPKFRFKIIEAAKKEKWETNKGIYAKTIEDIHNGKITEVEQIDAKRGNGLSNVDADKLINKLGADEKKYKQAINYGKEKFKALFPKKDDLEKHLKWYDFVLDMQNEIEVQEKSKGRALTNEEAKKIIDGWLDEQVEEDGGFMWFDKKYRPYEQKMEGKVSLPPAAGSTPEDPLGILQ